MKINSFCVDPSVILHREKIAAYVPLFKPAEVPYSEALIAIDGGKINIPVGVYTPLNTQAPYPTLFYIPGTAYVAQETKFTHLICSHICLRAKYQIVAIKHRLAPEYTARDAFQDCYQVMKTALKSPHYKVGIDHSKVAVSGYSSGGNIAALIALQARKENIPIIAQILFSPLVELGRRLKTHMHFEQKDSDISEEFVHWFLSLAFPSGTNTRDPLVSPFWAEIEDLKQLPTTAIVWAENDRFRSDAEAYYKKIYDVGVYAKNFMVHGDNHAYLWRNLEVIERVAEEFLIPIIQC